MAKCDESLPKVWTVKKIYINFLFRQQQFLPKIYKKIV